MQSVHLYFDQVARDAVLRFRPHISITPYHANVKDPDFNVDFFKQFNVVLNGLDNLDARRHVNRLCLAADVPLVESGTTGFLGQVMLCLNSLLAGYFSMLTNMGSFICNCIYTQTSVMPYIKFLVHLSIVLVSINVYALPPTCTCFFICLEYWLMDLKHFMCSMNFMAL